VSVEYKYVCGNAQSERSERFEWQSVHKAGGTPRVFNASYRRACVVSSECAERAYLK
jgi:hypothetical protein